MQKLQPSTQHLTSGIAAPRTSPASGKQLPQQPAGRRIASHPVPHPDGLCRIMQPPTHGSLACVAVASWGRGLAGDLVVATLQQPLYPGLPALEQPPSAAWRQQALQLWEPAAAEIQDRTAPAAAELAGSGVPGRGRPRTQMSVTGLLCQTTSSCTPEVGAHMCSEAGKLQLTQDVLLLMPVNGRSDLTLGATLQAQLCQANARCRSCRALTTWISTAPLRSGATMSTLQPTLAASCTLEQQL